MLNITRAILQVPKILLDEISEGLQTSMVDRARECLMSEHGRLHASLILVEQNLDFISSFAHPFGLMARGRVLREGSLPDTDARENIHHHLAI
jgi:ABC-type branched-subunit amino acid transport system ATPase component